MLPEYRTVVMRNNGDVLPTLLVDGFVAGVWRPVEEGIEATAFHRLSDDEWAGLDAEASRSSHFSPREIRGSTRGDLPIGGTSFRRRRRCA